MSNVDVFVEVESYIYFVKESVKIFCISLNNFTLISIFNSFQVNMQELKGSAF